jgi:hypothetical protein
LTDQIICVSASANVDEAVSLLAAWANENSAASWRQLNVRIGQALGREGKGLTRQQRRDLHSSSEESHHGSFVKSASRSFRFAFRRRS